MPRIVAYFGCELMFRIAAYFGWDFFRSRVWWDSSLIRCGWHPKIIEGGHHPTHAPSSILPPCWNQYVEISENLHLNRVNTVTVSNSLNIFEDTTHAGNKGETMPAIMKCSPLLSYIASCGPLSLSLTTSWQGSWCQGWRAAGQHQDDSPTPLSLETCNLRHVTAYGLKYCPIWDSFFTAESTLKFIRTMKCSIFASEQVWKTSTTGYLHLFAIYTFSGFSSPFSSLGPVLCCRPFPFLTLR